MIYLLSGFMLCSLIALLWLGWRRQQESLRENSIRVLLDGADALERQLQECRDQVHNLKNQLTALPEEMSAEAQSALSIDAQVQVALRDLLAHRLWIKQHAGDATQQQFDQACCAMQHSREMLAKQLQRLKVVNADLVQARALSNAPTHSAL